ncbi:MAG TPA: pirin family protein [Steroidobacteraceae bacterium]|nr:pirin family protein [Steroidobacteraceae bacterium]
MNDATVSGDSPIAQLISPPARDLGDGFVVHRALPAPQRRTLGPFVFFDSMGPASFAPGRGMDVRPHPHIGLATVTYLFDGEVLHRDSLGNAQVIRPGEVNWMIAGRGIVHSERTPPAARQGASSLAGLQLWVALPRAQEEMPPAFSHHDSAALPLLQHGGVRLQLIAGTLGGARSPVPALSPMFYADAQLAPGARLGLDTEHAERGFFVSTGQVQVAGRTIAAGPLVVLRAGETVNLTAGAEGARVLLLGGAALDGPRTVWWNFVSSSRERVQRAAQQWRAGGFDPVPDDSEFIPLPDTPIPAARADAAAPRAPAGKPVDYP